jgi:uncharacterized protein YjcR
MEMSFFCRRPLKKSCYVVSLSQKQLECVGFMSSGVSQRKIAETLNITPKTIQRWQKLPEFSQALRAAEIGQERSQEIAKVAAEVVQENKTHRDHLRDKELKILDKIQENLEVLLSNDPGNLRAIDRLIRVSETRSKLLGLNVRTYAVMDAMELLLQEHVVTFQQASIVSEGIYTLEENLRNFETETED